MNGRRLLAAALLAGASVLAARESSAFCGFYVGGAGAKLFNDATVVVMMREGTRTVLAMQNAYKGPPEKFAMVVPVPVVLQEENVKTLPRAVFDHVDQLASPRLVEYWEQDPCAPQVEYKGIPKPMAAAARAAPAGAAESKDYGVTIEAQFTVGEYQIVILSAQDSGGLDAWLKKEQYSIPEGAEPYFRPYVASGSKFFVAKVDIQKVKMENGLAVLSPLRFHYDSEEFRLPVRLGLINSSGTQDLIVHVLAHSRYEVANYPNVTIPTNFDVAEAASDKFPTFYTTLFDRTLEKNPKAVVTEYAWEPTSCDPCPGPALDWNDLATLGYDVLPSQQQQNLRPVPPPGGFIPSAPPLKPTTTTTATTTAAGRAAPPGPAPGAPMRRPMMVRPGGGQWVLTRLHARYTKDSLGEDLVFKEAPAIVGGREIAGADGKLEHGATPSGYNNFQARYAIRHPWTGPIDCKEPRRGVWGGRPNDPHARPAPKAAAKLALAEHTKADLSTFVKTDIPEIGFTKGSSTSSSSSSPTTSPAETKKGCMGCAVTTDAKTSAAWLAAFGFFVAALRRRLRSS
jgi:MYXO-CTERM domain-containing protein